MYSPPALVKDVWSSEIWPKIQKDFEKLQKEGAVSQSDGAVGSAYNSERILEKVRVSGEARHYTGNLTWTPPVQNADSINMGMVDKCVEAHFRAADGGWQAPKIWWRGCNLPIVLRSTAEMPPRNDWKRYGLDLLVLACWRALQRARDDGAGEDVLAGFLRLFRSVPFDFKLFRDDAEITLGQANLSESFEKQRELFGLTGLRLIALVEDVRRIIAGTSAKANAANVAEYLAKNIQWSSAKRVPSPETVDNLMRIGAMMAKATVVQSLVQMSEVQFGRDHMFEEWSKLQLVSQKCTGTQEYEFVMCGLYVEMVSRKQGNPFSKAELASKAGAINFWIFARRLNKHLLNQFAATPATPEQERLVQRMQAAMNSPLEWLRFRENQSWTSGLPPLLAGVLEVASLVMSGAYNRTLKGLLGSPPPGGLTPTAFLASTELLPQAEKLETLLRKQQGVEETEGSKDKAADKAAATKAPAADDLEKPDNLAGLEADAQRRAADQLARSVVFVVPDATSTWQQVSNLIKAQDVSSLAQRFFAFYDPKNAARARVYAAQNKLQRVPVLQDEDFRQFLLAATASMEAGRDFLFVLSGKVRSNEVEIEKQLTRAKIGFKRIIIAYDATKMKNAGYWRRMKGLANSASSEILYMGWLGKMPTENIAKSRMYCDPGSPTYLDVVAKVPVATSDEVTMVDLALRDAVFPMTDNVAVAGADDEQDEASSSNSNESQGATKRSYAKRGSGKALFRTPSSNEVALSPMDNSGLFLRELCHMVRPSWVLFGTPAGGSGLYGVLQGGVPIVAIVRNNDHMNVLSNVLKKRLARDMLSSSSPLMAPDLLARAQKLLPPPQRKEKKRKVSASENGSLDTDGSESMEEEEVEHDPPKKMAKQEKAGNKSKNKPKGKKMRKTPEKKDARKTPEKKVKKEKVDTSKKEKKEKKDK